MKAEDIPALTPEARLHARATANSIVLGVILAELADLHPGSRERMRAQADAVLASATQGFPKPVTDEVVQAVKVLLEASNI